MLSNATKILTQNVSKSLTTCRSKHTLPDLPYDYNALEPIISADIMKLHHQKHHQTYVNNLNVAEEKFEEAKAKNDLNTMIALGPALKFNGGGHLNHSIFWETLCCKGSSAPTGCLADAIKRDFGTYENMVQKLSALSVGVQGSGWGWLGYNKQFDRLELAALPNQDPLFPSTGLHPLFGIDVWEHAYYLQYKNMRADYVKNIFQVANWRKVEEYFEKVRK